MVFGGMLGTFIIDVYNENDIGVLPRGGRLSVGEAQGIVLYRACRSWSIAHKSGAEESIVHAASAEDVHRRGRTTQCREEDGVTN